MSWCSAPVRVALPTTSTRNFDCESTVALDFNPMLMLVANSDGTRARKLKMYTSFRSHPSRWKTMPCCGRSQRPRKPAMIFTWCSVTPCAHRLPTALLRYRGNAVADRHHHRRPARTGLHESTICCRTNGRWVNFGSLAFSSPQRALQYSPEETKGIVAECGFSDPYVAEATIPYMCSPGQPARPTGEGIFILCLQRTTGRQAGAPPRPARLDCHRKRSRAADTGISHTGNVDADLCVHHVAD